MRLALRRTEVDAGEAFRQALAEGVERAWREKRAYSVIACVPRHLPGEVTAEVAQVAMACVRDLMRGHDLAGHLTDEVLAVGLPDTGEAEARAVAHRLKSELSLRVAHLRSTAWEAGFACLAKDGWTSEELIQSAIQAAATSRRRFAEKRPTHSLPLG